jgi:glycosyltransferase involved in cell wall biosynthesis
MKKKVTILLPAYNEAESRVELEHCMQQVVDENSLYDWEFLLVNDGSTDNCQAIIYEFAAKDGRITPISQPNQGVQIARNNGVKIAKGEYIAFIDSDDIINKDFIRLLLHYLTKNRLISMCPNGTSLQRLQAVILALLRR